MSTVIGIDLGTSNSAVAGIVGEQYEVIADSKNHKLTPSIVSFGKNLGQINFIKYGVEKDEKNTNISGNILTYTKDGHLKRIFYINLISQTSLPTNHSIFYPKNQYYTNEEEPKI